MTAGHLPALAGALLTALAATAAAESPSPRTFRFVYEATIGPIPAGAGPVHIFVPLAREDELQEVTGRDIEASIAGAVEREELHGNVFWHGSVPVSDGAPIAVRIEQTVRRRPFLRPSLDGARALSAADRERLALFLAASKRERVRAEVLEPILTDIRRTAKKDTLAARSRAIYDWVVDNMEYKKVGTGWGHGDTYWACSQRYGNCTDFHALFNSLARTEGIPARFEIGFPVPDDRPHGEVGGYHCWSRFYLPGAGWLPIDASEAFKHPDRRDLLYGSQPPDRIHLTTGRDLRLGPDHRDGALNYFVYPHVEVGGEQWEGRIDKRFSYRDAGAPQASTADPR